GKDLLDVRVAGECLRVELGVASYDALLESPCVAFGVVTKRVAYRAALHGDNRVVSVATFGCRGESGHVARGSGAQDSLGHDGRDVVALVDDDVPVAGEDPMDNLTKTWLRSQVRGTRTTLSRRESGPLAGTSRVEPTVVNANRVALLAGGQIVLI